MKDEELILKAVEYCNDNPARVKDFLRETTPPTKGEEPKPMFKVGQWVTDDYYKEVIRFGYTEKDGRVYDTNGYLRNVGVKYLRHATPQEIESHLRKICDDKYIGKKVKCLSTGRGIIKEYNVYEFKGDTLWYTDNYGSPMMVYRSGKFAEIIPEKKKLPKTKEEFNSFLGAYCNRHTSSVAEFLKDYED